MNAYWTTCTAGATGSINPMLAQLGVDAAAVLRSRLVAMLDASLAGEVQSRRDVQEAVYEVSGLGPAQVIRRMIIGLCSYALPCAEVVASILERDRPIVEIGAGSGYWAAVLAAHGAQIVATDKCAPGEINRQANVARFFPVETMAAREAVTQYGAYDVLCIWPSEGAPWFAHALAQCRSTVHYIGTARGGCTADAAAFDLLDQRELVRTEAIPAWPGSRDRYFCYGADAAAATALRA